MMYPGHRGVEQSARQRYSHDSRRVGGLAQQPTLQSNIPLRASAHPSEMPVVRPRYPRHLSDLERITDVDVSRLPTRPQRSGVGSIQSGMSQRGTGDHLIEHIFRNIENIVSIDEIDTLPSHVQTRLHPRLKSVADEQSMLSEMDTRPTASVQRKGEGVSLLVETPQLALMQLPTGLERGGRGFSILHGFDNVRWWLLYPGRIEFLFWLVGAFVLVCLTSLFLLMATASLGLFGSGGAHGM